MPTFTAITFDLTEYKVNLQGWVRVTERHAEGDVVIVTLLNFLNGQLDNPIIDICSFSITINKNTHRKYCL